VGVDCLSRNDEEGHTYTECMPLQEAPFGQLPVAWEGARSTSPNPWRERMRERERGGTLALAAAPDPATTFVTRGSLCKGQREGACVCVCELSTLSQEAAFGQLPMAWFGGKVKIAQSMAIVRFIARKMGASHPTP